MSSTNTCSTYAARSTAPFGVEQLETVRGVGYRLHDALARQRGFVADVGHELHTPLATLRAELELAARPGRSREALAAAVTAAGQETDRLIRLAEDLLLLARAEAGQLRLLL
jgi:signal transduction histidine kinase